MHIEDKYILETNKTILISSSIPSYHALKSRIYSSWKLEIATYGRNETPSIQQRQKLAMEWKLNLEQD